MSPKELEVIDHLFLPLTKEVIRRLQIHLENKYNWQNKSFFGGIIKPTLYSFCFYVSLLVFLKMVKHKEVISDKSYQKGKIGIFALSGGVLGLWLFYNYKNEIFRIFRRVFQKNNDHVLALNQPIM